MGNVYSCAPICMPICAQGELGQDLQISLSGPEASEDDGQAAQEGWLANAYSRGRITNARLADESSSCLGLRRLVDDPSQPISKRLQKAALRIMGQEGVSSLTHESRALRSEQVGVKEDFARYLMDVVSQPEDEEVSRYGRIIMPPRTGKTVIAGHLIASTQLCSMFVVPTRILVEQSAAELRAVMPHTSVGEYYGDKKECVSRGVNVTTYSILQERVRTGKPLPLPLREAALIFADEAHHSMTASRMEALKNSLNPKAIRIALTATPDYSEERTLATYYPLLIHEITMLEAMQMGLLAKVRFWLLEVDADASKVRIRAGDFEDEELGNVMSEAPFFKAALAIRYAPGNAQMPALITCRSRAQAYEIQRYLMRKRPRGSSPPITIVAETSPEVRSSAIDAFEKGVIDTLISVGVLLEGWNSPRCKLLIDLAPSVSRVRATQKFTRVMTKHGADEARIYSLVPADLAGVPLLPMDVLGSSLPISYLPGTIMGTKSGEPQSAVQPLDLSAISSIGRVHLVQRLLTSGQVEKPRLSRHDPDGIRKVIESHPTYKPELLWGISEFRRIFFRHPLFSGTGEGLLRYLGIPTTPFAYTMLLSQIFDRDIDKPHRNRTCWRRSLGIETDMVAEALAIFQPPDEDWRMNAGHGPDQYKVWEGWRALGGAVEDQVLPDDSRLSEQSLVSDLYALSAKGVITHDELDLLSRRFGFDGEEQTQEEVGNELGRSKTKIGAYEAVALRKLRRHLFQTYFSNDKDYEWARSWALTRWHILESLPRPLFRSRGGIPYVGILPRLVDSLIPVLPKYSESKEKVISYGLASGEKLSKILAKRPSLTPTPARLLHPRTLGVIGYIGLNDGVRYLFQNSVFCFSRWHYVWV